MKRAVRRHYGLNRPITDEELDAEVVNLRRKDARGTLDDRQEALFIALGLDGGAVR